MTGPRSTLLEKLQTNSDANQGTAASYVSPDHITGQLYTTVLRVRNLPFSIGNSTGASFGSALLFTFPLGRINVLGVTLDDLTIGLTNAGNVTPAVGDPILATDGGDFSLGTTATSDATLDTTDVNLLPSTSIDPMNSTVTGAALAASAQFDGTSTAVKCYYNMIIDDGDVENGDSTILELNCTITITWLNLGDY